MRRLVLTFLLFVLIVAGAYAQKWQPGYFYDTKGQIEKGLIHQNPSGRPPIKDEGFIEFRDDAKADVIKLSASDIKAYVVGRDSFVVAATDLWSNRVLDFVRVALDTDLKLYAAFGDDGSGGGGGFSPQFGVGAGGGTGGMGGGLGGGISIPIGGSGGGKNHAVYFFGSSTADMKPISNQAFNDIMVEVMGDEPDVVEQIRAKKFNLGSIERLIAYYKGVEVSHR
ncbi:MAG: hypothetical protein ABI367_15800 [Mucilaginibacter sp.]